MDSFERLQKANSELDLHIEEQARGWREIIKRGRKPELFIDSEKRVRSEWKRLGGAERGGKLPEVEIGKELLYARKNSSWRKFVRDADNLEQRKKRMRMVLAAMEVLPLDCLEGNCWFQGKGIVHNFNLCNCL